MPVKKIPPTSDDYLFIEELEIPCRIGTTAEERATPQVISLSIQIYFSMEKAGRTDRIENTVDYARLIRQIQNLLQKKEFQLVEAVAEKVAELLLREKRVQKT